jgi:hypothetical protein
MRWAIQLLILVPILTRHPTQVSPSDSLNSIAIKYKIPLSELRRFNKLWTSDTVHLRKTILIPSLSRPRLEPGTLTKSATPSPRTQPIGLPGEATVVKDDHLSLRSSWTVDVNGSGNRLGLNGSGSRLSEILSASRELIGSRLSLDSQREDTGEHELAIVSNDKRSRNDAALEVFEQMTHARSYTIAYGMDSNHSKWGTEVFRPPGRRRPQSSQPRPMPAMKLPEL